MEYPVHEVFYSWQGEGLHLGRAAFFIRLHGCPVHCPWCDSAGTWHSGHAPAQLEHASVPSLVAQARETRAEFVVITGGEPAMHDLAPLTAALHEAALPVHLETCGAFPLRGEFDWVTLSPKWAAVPSAENLARADELKLIIETPEDIARWAAFLASVPLRARAVWLHPEWSHRSDAAVLAAITQWVRGHGAPFRAGWQVHKCYNADAADSRSRPPVPLGGRPEAGF
jgi:organic radical activating enzyme